MATTLKFNKQNMVIPRGLKTRLHATLCGKCCNRISCNNRHVVRWYSEKYCISGN